MSKPIFGLILGAILGVFDGLTALLSGPPEVKEQIMGIVAGSTVKGLIVGVLVGWFAKRVHSLPLGILAGLICGLAFAYFIAAFPDEQGRHYYWEIMLPGSIMGMIVGYATQKYGAPKTLGAR